jgi:succinyl-CoA synthetase beta subunit
MVNLAEFYGKMLFNENGIPVPEGYVASYVNEVQKIVEKINKPVVLKSQVLTGGRGKAGGMVLCPYERLSIEKYPAKVGEEAKRLFKLKIRGYPVRKILVEELLDIAKESYLALTYDDSEVEPLIMWSKEGGMDIEELARYGKVQRIPVGVEFAEKAFAQIENPRVAEIAKILYSMQSKYDADLLEINPLVTTSDGRILAADSKITIDDSAIFRQKELYQRWINAWYGEKPYLSESEKMEERIKELDLAYVMLDGNIGVIGNGAGLVMRTLDTILYHGGKPANFLDIGGGASSEKMKNAIDIVLSNPRVKAMLINVFGGITNCAEIAKGIVSMKDELKRVPFAIRLLGFNYEEGIRILHDEGIEASTDLSAVLKYVVKHGE